TGEVAVVISESRTRRLRPKVMILLNADKSEREDFIICNMLNETHSKDGTVLNIKYALPQGSFNIQADDYFL
ncbi:MAG: HD-GYP domain-containing protein, partial [Gammaproteobacteria bacterium]|nr:HD-GYP domain-containing protein [Gammaproteobacteria bacterium]